MAWKYYFTIFIAIFFFLTIIIAGTNISAERLAVITDKEIPPPFQLTALNDDVVAIDILGSQHDYSLEGAKNGYASAKVAIQNSYVAVKCNLIPRTDYLQYQWEQGTTRLKKDLRKIINYLEDKGGAYGGEENRRDF